MGDWQQAAGVALSRLTLTNAALCCSQGSDGLRNRSNQTPGHVTVISEKEIHGQHGVYKMPGFLPGVTACLEDSSYL